MNTERIARGWDLIAEGAAEIALAYRAIEQPAARAGGPVAGVPPASAPADYDEDPSAYFDDAPQAPETPQTALGMCPEHREAWSVKAGGISKAGKPYRPFWKCNGKTNGEYCKQKPTKAWADSHPIREDVAA